MTPVTEGKPAPVACCRVCGADIERDKILLVPLRAPPGSPLQSVAYACSEACRDVILAREGDMNENMQPHYTTVRVPERPERGGRLVPMVPALTWQTTPPDVPGYYWVKPGGVIAGRPLPPCIVMYRPDGRTGKIMAVNRGDSDVTHWSGPLVPPGGE